ncbi:MAG: protein kinase [Acidobacteriota bacterium]|nr:protein kinase [Acidobacteriota bacterium]
MLAINEVLQQGRYRIINQSRQDAIGAVYEAFDNLLETNVLLKENSANLRKVITVSQMETRKLAFAEEAKILTEIKHESLLHVRDYFSEIDRQYLVLEYADGNSLSELLKKDENSFALSDVANWADQLLNALNYLHTHTPPIIHLDINPQNLKLTSGGKIKLLAFDIAKSSDSKVNNTVPIQNFGAATLYYLPLEQIWGRLDSATQRVITNSYDEKSIRVLEQPADARSDIYALGATLYHLLTARFPIDALERSIDILEGKPDPLPTPHELNPIIPPEVSEVLMKSLEIRRENRFYSAVIMRQVLRTAFVRVKEREVQEAKKLEDVLELPSAEQQRLEAERQLAEQKRLRIEAKQNRQAELVKQQLLEAETQKLKAVQSPAEVEKPQIEKETKDLGDKESLTTTIKSSGSFTQISSPVVILPELVKERVSSENSSDEFKDLFAAPQKDNTVWRRMSAVAAILVLFGGGILGFWILQTPGTAESNQTFSDRPASLTEKAVQPTVEAVSVPNVETTPEISATPMPALPQNFTEKPVSQPAVKIKPTPPRVEKPTPPPTKTPKPLRAITVDDLINN